MDTINIYSTQKRAKTTLETLEPGRVRMYVCGPTVYDSCHIGHARPAICFDIIRRYLEYAGYAVTFISNITDIDDKIINRAQALGLSWRDLAQRYQDEYERDMTLLGVRSPSIRPRATEHIPEMLALIQTLMDKGVAYANARGVWFDVTKYPAYGQLSGRASDDDTTEHRVEQDPDKRHTQDFALWKAAKPGEPEWDSPWGKGRPGWHIECSAMSGKYCGFQLDIHGGGADLAFPHHENERAQSEAATGKEFVRQWMHNGFITVASSKGDGGDEKMGKSKNNAFWLKDVFKEFPPAAVRLWILGTHYRMPLSYSSESLKTSMGGLARIYNCLEEAERVFGPQGLAGAQMRSGDSDTFFDPRKLLEFDAQFRAAMNDDFNTPQALAAIYEEINFVNSLIQRKFSPAALGAPFAMLQTHLSVLGLPLSRPAGGGGAGIAPFVELLLQLRTEAKAAKDYALSDRVRDGLAALNVEIADRKDGATWQMK